MNQSIVLPLLLFVRRVSAVVGCVGGCWCEWVLLMCVCMIVCGTNLKGTNMSKYAPHWIIIPSIGVVRFGQKKFFSSIPSFSLGFLQYNELKWEHFPFMTWPCVWVRMPFISLGGPISTGPGCCIWDEGWCRKRLSATFRENNTMNSPLHNSTVASLLLSTSDAPTSEPDAFGVCCFPP